MSKHQESREEEIDLGSLFILIGRGFSRFFNFIGFILKKIYFFFIYILLFVKIHFLKIIIAGLIGASAGAVLEYIKKEKTYISYMVLQPNYESSRQFYSNVLYYSTLIDQREVDILSRTLGISKDEAASLRKIGMRPLILENDIVKLYYKSINSIDSTATSNYSYDQFKKSFTTHEYKLHKLYIEATDKFVFSKLGKKIISSVEENQYYQNVRANTIENLHRMDSLLRRDLYQLDTLKKVYMTATLEEAKNNKQGTSVNIGERKTISRELALFDVGKSINKTLEEVSKDISEKTEVVNIISDFQPVGYKIDLFSKNYVVLFSALGMLLVICFLLLKKLNSYLNTFKQ